MRLATGEYFLFMDNDDTLFTPWALTAFADALQEDRADLLYADNVIIDPAARCCGVLRNPIGKSTSCDPPTTSRTP